MSTTQNPDQHAEANREYFNKIAAEYDARPHAMERVKMSTDAILKIGTWDKESTSLLEYACGTGLISSVLVPHTRKIIGVDVSEAMVGEFNKKIVSQGLSKEKMSGVVVELKGEDSELEGEKFDFVVCAQSYHHFPSLEETTAILVSFLKPGTGRLIVTDMTYSTEPASVRSLDGDPTSASETRSEEIVPHLSGFTEETIREVFKGAGLQNIQWKTIGKAHLHGKFTQLFIAEGTRPKAKSA